MRHDERAKQKWRGRYQHAVANRLSGSAIKNKEVEAAGREKRKGKRMITADLSEGNEHMLLIPGAANAI